ncbi:MAG: hypothetical protein GY916_07880 [Gammaproteobacteria bacterium]|nr:hypothetical protein [Gammaproteobacteria bacterium]
MRAQDDGCGVEGECRTCTVNTLHSHSGRLKNIRCRPQFEFRHSWQMGDLLLWNNRLTRHYPINDSVRHLRLLIRCTAMEPRS